MKGPLDVERNCPRLRSGVDPVLKRSLLARTFMAPIPTAETQLLRFPGGRPVVKGLCGRDPAKDVRAAPCATDTTSATAAALGRSFQSSTLADLKMDFSNDFRPLRRFCFLREWHKRRGVDVIRKDPRRRAKRAL